ncbi:hypothetical protein GCM10011387_30550 [Pedobacter quisquiliarum]|uniref:Uncharacterized protein n=1 Tax=Pedobacter quisquiliarum TaxID=1834438 RepID=A0A916UJY2_9SPHI|nr:hypothetical protein GCM10011387_30550 [Pedobacter quisquiliarum]
MLIRLSSFANAIWFIGVGNKFFRRMKFVFMPFPIKFYGQYITAYKPHKTGAARR